MGIKRDLVVVAVLSTVLASAGAKAGVDAGVQGQLDPQVNEAPTLTVHDFDGWGMSWNWKKNYGVRDSLASRTVNSAKQAAGRAADSVTKPVRATREFLGL